MSKSLKCSFILFILIASISLAWRTLSGFFSGVGVNFVVMVVALGVILYLVLTDGYVKNRVMDLFVLSCIMVGLELLVFMVCEFGWFNLQSLKGINIYQSIISLVSLLFLVYIMFRFLTETKNVRVNFVESILGNQAREKKEKKSKELTNGSLEEKPNQRAREEVTSVVSDDTSEN